MAQNFEIFFEDFFYKGNYPYINLFVKKQNEKIIFDETDLIVGPVLKYQFNAEYKKYLIELAKY